MIVKFSVILSSSSTSDWTVDNTLSIISIVLVIIGGIFTFIQWAAANHIKRTELISQILEKLRFDDDMIFAMQIIDYGNDWYNDEFHDGTNGYEQKFNKLFSYLSYICYLYQTKALTEKDFSILKYEIHRVCTCYLWNLYHFSKDQGTDCSFQHLIDYGIENDLIPRTRFFDSNSSYYIKRIGSVSQSFIFIKK